MLQIRRSFNELCDNYKYNEGDFVMSHFYSDGWARFPEHPSPTINPLPSILPQINIISLHDLPSILLIGADSLRCTCKPRLGLQPIRFLESPLQKQGANTLTLILRMNEEI